MQIALLDQLEHQWELSRDARSGDAMKRFTVAQVKDLRAISEQ